jgi:hypothetical protein
MTQGGNLERNGHSTRVSFSGIRLGRLANEPDQKHDHPILVPVIYVWKTVLARNADITLRILPWVFAVVPAGIPVVERWRQELDLTGITPYCLYLPPAYLTFGIQFPVERPRDHG